MGDGQSVVVLKAGDWILDGDSIGRVVLLGGEQARGYMLVEFYEPDRYLRRVPRHESEVTKLDEALYPILSDSITNKEE